MIKQVFEPQPGRIAVIREAVSEIAKKVTREDGSEVNIFRTEESQEFEKKINPWALVVGVGAPRVTDYGTTITTDVERGNQVLVGEVGRNVPLVAADGSVDYIYVLPFEGVLGTLAHKCDKCEFTWRIKNDAKEQPALDEIACPKCPVIEKPTDQETRLVGMTR